MVRREEYNLDSPGKSQATINKPTKVRFFGYREDNAPLWDFFLVEPLRYVLLFFRRLKIWVGPAGQIWDLHRGFDI